MSANSIKSVGKTVGTAMIPGIGSGLLAAKLGLKLTAPTAPPAPQPPNAPPTADSESARLQMAAEEQRKARSRQATIFTASNPNTSQGSGLYARKTLLGS